MRLVQQRDHFGGSTQQRLIEFVNGGGWIQGGLACLLAYPSSGGSLMGGGYAPA